MLTKHIRPIRIEGNIAYVPLTRGYEATIDAADVPLVNGCNWYARNGRNTVYASRSDHSGPKQRTILMHRIIVGDPDELEVDHIDGNGLNNRRCNLREATASQNMQNQRKRANNLSGFKGVYWHKRDSKWRARITINGKQKHLGLFAVAEDAYAAYCAASEQYHGEFGRTQ